MQNKRFWNLQFVYFQIFIFSFLWNEIQMNNILFFLKKNHFFFLMFERVLYCIKELKKYFFDIQKGAAALALNLASNYQEALQFFWNMNTLIWNLLSNFQSWFMVILPWFSTINSFIWRPPRKKIFFPHLYPFLYDETSCQMFLIFTDHERFFRGENKSPENYEDSWF